MLYLGTFQSAGVIQAAYELNNPLDVHTLNPPKGVQESKSFFSVDNPQVILETIKKVRLYDYSSIKLDIVSCIFFSLVSLY